MMIDPTSPRAPKRWVWYAAAGIAFLALYGLYRGFAGVEASEGLLGQPLPGTAAPLDASSAAALPHDDQWSTLSGPKILPPPPPKPVQAAKVDDSADSDAPDDQSAADNADDNAPDDTAPPPKTKVVKPPPVVKPAAVKAPAAKAPRPAAPNLDDSDTDN